MIILHLMQFTIGVDFAKNEDSQDPLFGFRSSFYIPKSKQGEDAVYLCGNSLGLQPKGAEQHIKDELEDWKTHGVEGHFQGKRPWFHYHKFLTEKIAAICGAIEHEVVVMNQLTVNLHLLLVSFYRPTGKRYKIIMEAGAFPSDMYAIQSQVEFHGFSYDDAVIEIQPRVGEYTLRQEDILKTIDENADSLALVFFSGVQYYTGQTFDIEAITTAGHAAGALVGFDLAHAAGNLELQLHAWKVDFAAWCSYKYLNSGPGNVSGVFIHEAHGLNSNTPRFAGWWGYQEKSRFEMRRGFIPEPGAAGWQLSNAPVFGMAIHLASLEIFAQAGMPALSAKSRKLTAYLRFLLEYAKKQNSKLQFDIITPLHQPGCQLSLLTDEKGKALFDHLTNMGVMCDWREPNVIRMAPVPLYNNFMDCYRVGLAFQNF